MPDDEIFDEEFMDYEDLPTEEEILEGVSFDEMKAFFLERIISQDDSVESALINIYSYFRAMAKGQPNNFNFFLCGPSGCGKTEFTRVLTEYCRTYLPFVNVSTKDTSSLTSEGFKGADKDFIISGINKSQYAIVFLDEIDKMLVPKFTSTGEQVSIEVQSGILQMVEGNEVTLSSKSGGNYKKIDTSKILFIGCGAFEGIEEYQKAVVLEKEEVDFGYRNDRKAKVRQPLTHDDIVRWGGLPQLVGRFCEVINFSAVNAGAMKALVELRLNDFRPMFDFEIKTTDRFISHIADCIDTKFGVRILKAELWKHLKRYTLDNAGGDLMCLTLDWVDGHFEGICELENERSA